MSIEITPTNLRDKAALIHQYQRMLPAQLPALLTETAQRLEQQSNDLWKWNVRSQRIREIAVRLGVNPIDVWGDGHGEPSIDEIISEMGRIICTQTTN